MGYTTEFFGSFKLDKRLDNDLKDYLIKFNQTRRMKRRLPPEFGKDGEFYVDGGGYMGQDREPSVVDFNTPPGVQPSLWCQWVPNEDGTEIIWDGGEKFYHYTEWLHYLIVNFIGPEGYILNGTVRFQGEDETDKGTILVANNTITVLYDVDDVLYKDIKSVCPC